MYSNVDKAVYCFKAFSFYILGFKIGNIHHKMEPLSKKSHIVASPETAAVDLPETLLSFSNHFPKHVQLTTPPTPDSRIFSMEILPSPSSELHVSQCELVTKWRLLKKDNSAIAIDDQIGIINGFGMLAFSSCVMKIGGVVYLPDFTEIDHFQFLKLLLTYSDLEKKSILKKIG